jgi:hypothetical protein
MIRNFPIELKQAAAYRKGKFKSWIENPISQIQKFWATVVIGMSTSRKPLFPYRAETSLDFGRAIRVLAWIDEPRSDQTIPCGLPVIVNIPATDQLLKGHPKPITVPSRPVTGTDSTFQLSMQLRKDFWLYAEHCSLRDLLLWRYVVIGRILSLLSSLQELERTLFRIIRTRSIKNYIGFDLVWILKGSMRAHLWWKSRT